MPVTVIARLHIKPGREADYEALMAEFEETILRAQPGYLGRQLVKSESEPGLYVHVVNYSGFDVPEGYLQTDAFKAISARNAEFQAVPIAYERFTTVQVIPPLN
jgi:quinol monooxygenase YgiN